MNVNTKLAIVGLALALAIGSVAPSLADGVQDQKNNDRNVTIGAGAVGILGLLTHSPGVAILGGVVAAGAASQYEQDRHVQSQEQNDGYYPRYYGRGPGYGGSSISIGGFFGGGYHHGYGWGRRRYYGNGYGVSIGVQTAPASQAVYPPVYAAPPVQEPNNGPAYNQQPDPNAGPDSGPGPDNGAPAQSGDQGNSGYHVQE